MMACATDVYDLLHASGTRLGLTSVYRVLGSFTSTGIVHVFRGEEQRFRMCARTPHAHLVCEACGLVVERPADIVRHWLLTAVRDADFVPYFERSDVYGRCRRCRPGTSRSPSDGDTRQIARLAGPRLTNTNENGYQSR